MGARRVSKQGVTVSQGNAIEVTNTAGTVLFSVDNTGNIGALPNLTAKGSLITASATSTPTTLAVGTNEQRLVADSATTSGLKYVADTTNYAIAAKGDLLVGTAADTVAALTVGSNGDTLVADSVASTGLRWSGGTTIANPVINGGFDIWQRGTSGFVPGNNSTTFAADRWNIQRGVTGSTVSRQTTSDTTNLPFIQYAMRVARDSGNTSTEAIRIGNSFESVTSIPFAGKTVTLSFYARAGANYSATSSLLNAELRTGTGTDQNTFSTYTGSATPISSDVTLTTTWQRFSLTGTVASTATEMAIKFVFTPVGTAGANDWYEITGVQIDVGSVALPFRRAGGTIQGEIALAQRYYEKSYNLATAPGDATSNGANSGTRASGGWQTPIRFAVTKRTTPTVTVYSTQTGTSGRIRNRDAGTDEVASAADIGQTGLPYVSGTGSTAGVLYTWQWEASAEL